MKIIYSLNFFASLLVSFPWLLCCGLGYGFGSLFGFGDLKKFSKNCAIAYDQFANTVTGGAVDETISSRLGYGYQNGGLKWFALVLYHIVNGIFFLQKNHCVESIEENIDRSDELWSWRKREVLK